MHNILPFCSRKMDTHKLLWLLRHNKHEMPTLRCMSFQEGIDHIWMEGYEDLYFSVSQ
jgi:hypothetical protein